MDPEKLRLILKVYGIEAIPCAGFEEKYVTIFLDNCVLHVKASTTKVGELFKSSLDDPNYKQKFDEEAFRNESV